MLNAARTPEPSKSKKQGKDLKNADQNNVLKEDLHIANKNRSF